MGRPQQPELARSAKTNLDPDHVETELQARPPVPSEGPTGPVPAENQPGHHPDEDQDKPDLDAFVAKFRGEDRPEPPAATETPAPAKADTPAKAEPAAKPATAAKADTPAKAEPAAKAKPAAPARAGTGAKPQGKTSAKTSGATRKAAGPAKGTTTRPAPSRAARTTETPTGSAKPAGQVRPTPAQRPAGTPGWPESAPAPSDPGPLGEPSVQEPSGAREERPDQAEPAYIGIALFPLRATLKGLEWLERSLSGRRTDRNA